MKRDIILTCEYNSYNQSFFRNLRDCSFGELKTMLQPLYLEVCTLSFDEVLGVHLDECAFKGGFLALTLNLNEEDVPGTENLYHSDMIMFLNIHKTEYNQDPDKQLIVFENEAHQQVFSTQIYPVFLQDQNEYIVKEMDIQRLWTLVMKLTPGKHVLRNKLEKFEELKEILKYR